MVEALIGGLQERVADCLQEQLLVLQTRRRVSAGLGHLHGNVKLIALTTLTEFAKSSFLPLLRSLLEKEARQPFPSCFAS